MFVLPVVIVPILLINGFLFDIERRLVETIAVSSNLTVKRVGCSRSQICQRLIIFPDSVSLSFVSSWFNEWERMRLILCTSLIRNGCCHCDINVLFEISITFFWMEISIDETEICRNYRNIHGKFKANSFFILRLPECVSVRIHEQKGRRLSNQ